MFTFFNTNKKTYLLWAIFLSLAIVCAQSVKLHVHNIEHDHSPVESAIEHSHVSEFHLSVDISHAEYHHEVMPEIDLGMNALIKDISDKVITLALLVTVLALFLYSFYSNSFFRRRRIDAVFYWRYNLSPPLRAPPL